MPYGYGYTGQMSGTPATGAGGGLGAASPYLQLALQLVQGLRKPGAGEGIANNIQQMGASRGVDVNLPNEPGILDKRRQAGMQVGETALNFVPVVGGGLSALASGARAAKTADAQQQYLKHIFAANPELFQQGETRFQSEFTPQTNFLANYAEGQPKFLQHGAEKMTDLSTNKYARGPLDFFSGGVNEIQGKIGQAVLGSKKKQEHREETIHEANLKKARGAEETLRVNAQDAMARRMAMGNAQAAQARALQGQAQQGILAQLLSPPFSPQGPQGLQGPQAPQASPFAARNYGGF